MRVMFDELLRHSSQFYVGEFLRYHDINRLYMIHITHPKNVINTYHRTFSSLEFGIYINS